ncbi:MAG TPA: ATP-binding protein [Burkholderiales bacterium]|jgi:signal transduction histidine kinase|nr:ATP-binding protein [Burkholderiales bacterium]
MANLKLVTEPFDGASLLRALRALHGERDLAAAAKRILPELAVLIGAQRGVLYAQRGEGDAARLELAATYALEPGQNVPRTLRIGESLVGQCAQERKPILIDDVPRDYVRVGSVLGSMTPLNVIIQPLLFDGEVQAVLELASLKRFSESQLALLGQLSESVGAVMHSIETVERAERLLLESRALAEQLRAERDELKQSNAQLQEKAEALLLASHYKSQFLASMSHELRTPLNSLLILARLLVDDPEKKLTAKQIEYAQTIYAAGTDLLTLINDILDLAKIESGNVVLDIESSRLSDLVDYFERTFRQVANDRKLKFDIRKDDAVPARIRTDQKRLQQILKNLLSNAIKFTERGKVTLHIRLARAGWSQDRAELANAPGVVAFEVEDTGIGIPEAQRGAIFEAFKAGAAGGAHYGGTGLGLSICRQLTRLLGGEIRVETTRGKGSRFTLYLPLEPAAEAKPPAAVRAPLFIPPPLEDVAPQPAKTTSALAGRKILIIDDDIRNIFALAGALEEHGIQVVDAESGKAGLDLLKRQSDIDAVLMDIMMPDLDGFDSIRLIRGLKQFRDLPIIAVTARAMKGDREKCIEAGATDYIAKPVNVSHLLSLLKGWLLR